MDANLSLCPLFAGISPEQAAALVAYLGREASYEKGARLFYGQTRVQAIGVVLEGSVQVAQEDYWGNRTILTRLNVGDVFGEAFACAQSEGVPVDVQALVPTRVLWLCAQRLLTPCASGCPAHTQLLCNLVAELAHKSIALTQKLEHVAKRATRQKLLSYLTAQARLAGSSHFTIPFTRQELADYLCVDRSAMCSELGRMRRDGLLEFDRNQFDLLSPSKSQPFPL